MAHGTHNKDDTRASAEDNGDGQLTTWRDFAIVALLSLLVYANAINGEFTFDDNSAVLENTVVLPETPWADVLTTDFWGTPMASNKSHKSYRPLTVASYRISYLLHGMDPVGYRAGNVLGHVVVSVLVLAVGSVLLQSRFGAVAAACLFAVHPVHTEAVDGVVGRAEVLCAVFYMATFLLYHYSVQSRSMGSSVVYAMLSCITFLLASFAKETGVTVWVVCAVWDIAHAWIRIYSHTSADSGGSDDRKTGDGKPSSPSHSALLAVCRIVMLIAVFFVYMKHRWSLTVTQGPKFAEIDNHVAFVEVAWQRWLTYSYIYYRYLVVLVFPSQLCCDYSYNCVPIIDEPLTDIARLIPAVALPLCVIGVALFAIAKCWRSFDYRPGMAFAWAIIPFLPAMHIYVTVATVLGERLLYIPSIGYVLALGYLLEQYGSATPSRVTPSRPNTSSTASGTSGGRLRTAIFVALLSLLAARTWRRNLDWYNNKALFKSGLDVCPDSAKLHLCYGVVLAQEKQIVEARSYFEQAVAISPDYAEAYYTLGKSYKETNELKLARKFLEKGISLQRSHFGLNQDLGIVYCMIGQMERGIRYLERAVRLKPTDGGIRNDIATALAMLKRYKEAVVHYEKALKYKPTEVHIYSNMASVLANLKRCKEAVATLQMAIKLGKGQVPNTAREIQKLCPRHLTLADPGRGKK